MITFIKENPNTGAAEPEGSPDAFPEFKNVIELMDDIKDTIKILDFGCGLGSFAIDGLMQFLNAPSLKQIEYSAIDINDEYLRDIKFYFNKHLFNAKILADDPKFPRYDGVSLLVPDNSVDFVFLIRTLHDIKLENLYIAFGHIFRILKKNGSLIIFDKCIFSGAAEINYVLWEVSEIQRLISEFSSIKLDSWDVKQIENMRGELYAKIRKIEDVSPDLIQWKEKCLHIYREKKIMLRGLLADFKARKAKLKKIITDYETKEADNDGIATNDKEVCLELQAQFSSLQMQIEDLKNQDSRHCINPFSSDGLPLKYGAASYINRECDHNLNRALKYNKLIAITGDFRVGKSSLLNQIFAGSFEQNNNWKDCYFNVERMDYQDDQLFFDQIFRKISQRTGKKIQSWDAIYDLLLNHPITFRFDEFGSITPSIASIVIPKFFSIAHTSTTDTRILISIPKKIDEFLRDKGLEGQLSPRLLEEWVHIDVKSFRIDEFSGFLELLPFVVEDLTQEHIGLIWEKSEDGNPFKLHCFCNNLFKAVKEGKDEKELIKVINDETSYNRYIGH